MILLAVGLGSCQKEEYDPEMLESWVWTRVYPERFASDGYESWSFLGNGNLSVYHYDVFSGLTTLVFDYEFNRQERSLTIRDRKEGSDSWQAQYAVLICNSEGLVLKKKLQNRPGETFSGEEELRFERARFNKAIPASN